MLFDARGADPFDLHLTYPIDAIDALRKKDWEKEQAKEKGAKGQGWRKVAATGLVAGEEWPQSALRARPAGGRAEAADLDDTAPHVIDLLDPLEF